MKSPFPSWQMICQNSDSFAPSESSITDSLTNTPSILSYDPDQNEVIDNIDPRLLFFIIQNQKAKNDLKVQTYILENPITPTQCEFEDEYFSDGKLSDNGSVDTEFSNISRKAMDLTRFDETQNRDTIEQKTKNHNALQEMIEAMNSKNQKPEPNSPRPKRLLFTGKDGMVYRLKPENKMLMTPIEVESDTAHSFRSSSDETSVMSKWIDDAKPLFPKSNPNDSCGEYTESVGSSTDDSSSAQTHAMDIEMSISVYNKHNALHPSLNPSAPIYVNKASTTLITEEMLIELLKNDNISNNEDVSKKLIGRDRKEPSSSPGNPFSFLFDLLKFQR